MHHNRLAAEMFPKIKSGQPMSQVSRSPDLLVAVDRALTSEERIDVDLVERVPVERRVAATVSRLARSAAPSSPHVLVTFRDLTEQDRLAQMRADFIANASHELRTPLASLRAFVETLQGPARDDVNARTRFLSLMASQAERMTRLIDDLLSLSRVEMRVHLPPRGIVELNETAAYVCQSLEPVAEAAEGEAVARSRRSAARIRGDREEIVQVLQNLIQNAIKYGREDGTIEVRIGRDAPRGAGDARVWVSVTDNGPGIAPEHLPRLTERFYRVNVASSREKGGTGLGLAIVKHIINRHRGELRIASRLGRGLDLHGAARPGSGYCALPYRRRVAARLSTGRFPPNSSCYRTEVFAHRMGKSLYRCKHATPPMQLHANGHFLIADRRPVSTY